MLATKTHYCLLGLARPLADYLYILDFEQMAWTRINPSGNGAGPRYTHGG